MFEPSRSPTKNKALKLSGDYLSKFFDSGKNEKEMEETIAKALEVYLNKDGNKDSSPDM